MIKSQSLNHSASQFIDIKILHSVRNYFIFKVIVNHIIVDRDMSTKIHQVLYETKIDGFRKGKIPWDILNLRFGPQIQKELAENYCNYAAKIISEKEEYKDYPYFYNIRNYFLASENNQNRVNFIGYIVVSEEEFKEENSESYENILKIIIGNENQITENISPSNENNNISENHQEIQDISE